MAAGQAGVSGSSTFSSPEPRPQQSPSPAGRLQFARCLGSEPPRRQHRPGAWRCFLPLPRGPQCFHYGGRRDPNSLFPPHCTPCLFRPRTLGNRHHPGFPIRIASSEFSPPLAQEGCSSDAGCRRRQAGSTPSSAKGELPASDILRF